MRLLRGAVLTTIFLLSAGCGLGGDEGDGRSLGSSTAAVSNGANDQGTTLSVTAAEASLTCAPEGGSASVGISYTVTSTAAADSADLTAIVDGGAETSIGTIASGSAGWTFDGRIKTATGTATFNLANGDHTIVICATQSGANGRLPKRACSDAIAVSIACEAAHQHCDQGVGNGSEGCDPGNSNHHNGSNDENGGTPGSPGRGH